MLAWVRPHGYPGQFAARGFVQVVEDENRARRKKLKVGAEEPTCKRCQIPPVVSGKIGQPFATLPAAGNGHHEIGEQRGGIRIARIYPVPDARQATLFDPVRQQRGLPAPGRAA